MWCVTYEDLDYFEQEVRALWEQGQVPDDPDDPSYPTEYHNDDEIGPSIHQVNKCYIKPVTQRSGGMSWALMRNPQGLECHIFATHCWAEGVFEFILKVRRNWPRGAKHLWACFLANPQNGNLGKILQEDLHKSPFARALRRAKFLLVVPNKRTSIYTRLWCVYEAFLSLHYVARNDLVISLPGEAPLRKLVANLYPGLLICACCAVCSYYALAPYIGPLLPPMLWIVSALGISMLVNAGVRPYLRLSGSTELKVGHEVRLGWCLLAIIGLGFGLVQHGLQWKYGKRTIWKWEKGEGWACGYLTLSVVLMHSRGIVDVMTRAIQRAEGGQLDFQTVRDANCSNRDDELRIRNAIRGYEDRIDKAINALRVMGKFDRATQMNIQYGMSVERARDGLGSLRVTTACCAWSYWWVTDLSAHYHHIYATQALGASCVVALSVQHWMGERAIFASDALLLAGMSYVVASLLCAHFLWGSEPLEDLCMSRRVWKLQLFFFVLMCLADLFYYTGAGAKLFNATSCNALAYLDRVGDDDADDSPYEDQGLLRREDRSLSEHLAIQGTGSFVVIEDIDFGSGSSSAETMSAAASSDSPSAGSTSRDLGDSEGCCAVRRIMLS